MVKRPAATARLRPLEPVPTGMTEQGSLQRPVKALLCDVYGTLLISAAGGGGAAGELPPERTLRQIVRLLVDFGIQMPAAGLLEQFQKAVGETQTAACAAGIHFPEIRVEEIWSRVLPRLPADAVRRFAFEMEVLLNPVWPMPHLQGLLEACRAQEIRLGIISNAQFYTPRLLRQLLGHELSDLGFDDPELLIFSYQHGQAKPAPLLFDIALRQLLGRGIAADETVYIGNDMRNDIVPASLAGFQTVLFAGDARSLRLRADDPFCSLAKPDLVVTDLGHLISYL